MSREPNFDASDFPHLREFARGYLHQDVIAEYGSAVEAAKGYVADLNEAERKQVAEEAIRLRAAAKGWTEESLSDSFAQLGGAVRFKSHEEVTRVLKVLAP